MAWAHWCNSGVTGYVDWWHGRSGQARRAKWGSCGGWWWCAAVHTCLTVSWLLPYLSAAPALYKGSRCYLYAYAWATRAAFSPPHHLPAGFVSNSLANRWLITTVQVATKSFTVSGTCRLGQHIANMSSPPRPAGTVSPSSYRRDLLLLISPGSLHDGWHHS